MDIQKMQDNIELVADMLQRIEPYHGWWVCNEDRVPIAPTHYDPRVIRIYYDNHRKTYCGAFGDM